MCNGNLLYVYSWTQGGDDGEPLEFLVTACGELPEVGAKLYTQPPAVASRDAIRRIFMAHGFTIKDGQTDLKPYVYEAAEALLRELSPAVAVPEEVANDAARYRWLLANYARGDGWQAIDDALNGGEADTKLSPAIDAAMK